MLLTAAFLLVTVSAYAGISFNERNASSDYTQEDPGLRAMIGQMLMVGFGSGTEVTETLQTDIAERNLGGVILLAYNVDSPQSLRRLTGDLQREADVPLFISIDQEGGRIARLNEDNGFSSTYTPEELGEMDSEWVTRDQAQEMSGWLRDGGVNINLAPVVDVNVNPDSPAIGRLNRSFSDDPYIVADHAGWFIDEFNQKDIITALKHFPGHGSATEDSHLDFTDISDTWKEKELVPYQELIDQGYSGMIMPGHLYHSDFDSEYPATLSGKTLTGKLRDDMGFDGVIISDGMFMAAIQEYYGFFESVRLAINAGIDILLYTGNYYEDESLVRQIVDYVEEQVDEGTIERSTIETSWQRIMQMKEDQLPTSADQLADAGDVPDEFHLGNYPNPFNSSTRITFELSRQQHVTLNVYDIQGRKIHQLASGSHGSGMHSYDFRADGLSSGVYLYRLETGDKRITRKMMLLQ